MEPTFKFNLNANEIQIIINALADQPFKVVQPLITKIIANYNAMREPPKAVSAPALTEVKEA